MKLATYKDGSRDGQLLVVSRDLSMAHYATGVANRLQQVLDDWGFLSPQLQDLYKALNQGRARHAFPFDPRQCMAPLPRAYQWVEQEAYPSPLAQDANPPPRWHAGDHLLGPCDPVRLPPGVTALDVGATLAVVTGDVALGSTPEQALEGIRLVLLAAVWSRPQAEVVGTAFSPVALTPDDLGDAWQQGRLHLPLHCACNGRVLGLCDAGSGMRRPFGQLLAGLSAQAELRAGSLVGAGPVRQASQEDPLDAPRGHSSLSDKRAREIAQDGQAQTPYLGAGDTLRLEMKGRDGHSLFGILEQTLEAQA